MRPEDRLGESIDEGNKGIRQCKVASPSSPLSRRYFDSEFCLHELAAIIEAHKLLIPIFYGIKPSKFILPPAVEESKYHAPKDIERFRLALQVANASTPWASPTSGYPQIPFF